MEPAAPGTEDEVQVSFPVYSKKASETDRLLSLKSYLPSGTYGNVFELSYVNGSEHWYCNMCECPVMGRVYHHEIGKRHSTNVANLSKRGVSVLVGQPVLHVAAGEPVPPGFEGELQKTCQIQERLDNYTVSPLIGLEYLLEIQEYDRDKEPGYLCMLCDKRGDPRTVIAHLVSYNHISQYLQRHFVKCYQALSPYMTKQYKRNWQNTMNKIAEAIEQQFGRLKPHPVEKEGFEEKKPSYWAQIFHGPHFSEKEGVTFEHLVIRDEITRVYEDAASSISTSPAATFIQKPSEEVSKRSYRKTGAVPSVGDHSRKRSPSPPIVAKPKKHKQPAPPGASRRRRSLSSVSSISSSDLSDYNSFEGKRSQRIRRDIRSRSRSRSPYRRPYYNRSPSPRNSRGKGVLPWQRPDYIKSRNEVSSDRNKSNSDKMEEYRKLAIAIENDMEKTLKQHERNPEKHPQYNEEWKIFWNKRYKELQAEGKDASSYDFKPEWIVFWNKRMGEIHNIEVKTKKDALRRRLGLPEQPAPICFRITGKKKSKDEAQSNKPVAPMASEPDQDHEVIIIEDKDEDTKSSKRSHSPWESEPTRPSSRVSRERSRERERSYERRSRDRERSYERTRDYKYRGSSPPDRRIKTERSWEKSWERESGPYRDVYRKDLRDCYKPPPVMRDVTRQPVFTPPRQEEEETDTEEINVVAVLRLLTALEEKLGSLGPKVIDMLGQALAMEKNEANSSEKLLDNDVNCVLFETVKEKLKGQLLAGLVDYAQERAFKNAIKKIASLIHYANQRRDERKKDKIEVDPVKVPGIGTVDKAAIAKQIAMALVLQGKTDVSQNELEQLINAVVGMAEASKTAGKPMTTASFIEQLNQAKVNSSTESVVSKTSTSESTSASQPAAVETSSNMEGLSDSDLQTLLQNFKDLSTEEQHGLITYLKKLEAKEPERVERLRKFVNLGPEKAEKDKRATSPFSARLGGVNPTVDDPFGDPQFVDDEKEEEGSENSKKKDRAEKEPSKIHIDSEEEEYTFDDVFQAANRKVKEKELEKEKEKQLDASKTETKINLMDAKALIANIMGNLNSKDNLASKNVSNNSGGSTSQFDNPTSAITAGSIAQAMDQISAENVKNLENIVGNLQGKMQSSNDKGSEDRPQSFSTNFQQPPSHFRTNFNLNLLNNEPVASHGNQYDNESRSPKRNQPNQSGLPNLPSLMGSGHNIRPSAPIMNRNPMMQQNVQYPMKNIYGGYSQNPSFPNQGNLNRPVGPGGPAFGNQTFSYDNRYGFNLSGPRPGGNFGGNRW
ncbi:hypothetical protein AMK59_6239 [Oryctes borbonicus]|uniref:Matrin-type domain-containing protein n=1 Tax=Oryctes borbonicus TaxID=1629725 RepID=A0A0T6B0X0_9SCAR|nr:hypothetical protein AMK59_6239 [Oryctes borbonicus]